MPCDAKIIINEDWSRPFLLPGEDVAVTRCPWCSKAGREGRLHRTVADKVWPHPVKWRKNDCDVVECEECEFIAEPVKQSVAYVDPQTREEIFVLKVKDVGEEYL